MLCHLRGKFIRLKRANWVKNVFITSQAAYRKLGNAIILVVRVSQ